VPVYCFDPRIFVDTAEEWGSKKTGAVRAKFIIESALCLRKSLSSLGNGLLLSQAKPEDFLP